MNKTALAGLGVFAGAIGFLAATTWQASLGKAGPGQNKSGDGISYQAAGSSQQHAQIKSTKPDEGANNSSITAGNKLDQRRYQMASPDTPTGRYERPRYRTRQYRRPYYQGSRRSYRPRYDYREPRRRTRRSYRYGQANYQRYYDRYERRPGRYSYNRYRRYREYRRYRQYKRYSRYRPYGRYDRYDRARRYSGYKGSNRQRLYSGFAHRQDGNRGADSGSPGAAIPQLPYGNCKPQNRQSKQSRRTAKKNPYPANPYQAQEMPQGNQDQTGRNQMLRPRGTRAI